MSASTNGSPPGFADRFRVESRLGRGGMGDVEKAYDTVLERTVAIKTLRPGNTGQQAVGRLLREARACAQLTHPGIVVIHDVLWVEGSVRIVMEHLPGASLESLHRFPRFSTLEGKIDILIRVLDALHYAHGRGVVHRDVKPTNVQLLPDGSVKLLDFGIAHLAGEAALTATGAMTGTAYYASPEQLRGEDSDAATDIYSAGILAFELLTRRRPFEGDKVAAVLTKVLNEPLPAAGTWLSEAFPELERIIRRAAAKRREDRFGTAEDMKNALAAFASSSREAIVAKQAELAATTERMLIEAKSLIASNRTAEAIPLLTSVLRTNPDADEARSLLGAGDGTSGAAGGPPADDEPTVLAGSGAPPPVSASAGEAATASRAGGGRAGAAPFSVPAPSGAGAPSSAETGSAVQAGAAPAATGATVHAGAESAAAGAAARAGAGSAASSAAQPWTGRRLLAAAAPVVLVALAVGVPAYFWMSAGPGDAAVPASAAPAPRDPGPAAVSASAGLPAAGSPDAPRASSGAAAAGPPGSAAAGGESSPRPAASASEGDAPRGGRTGARAAVTAGPASSPRPAVEASPASARSAAEVPAAEAPASGSPAAEAPAAEAPASGSPAPAPMPALGAKNMYYAATEPGPAAPVPAAAAAAANAGIKYRILLRAPDGAAREVDAETMFQSGDRIRFAFEPNVDGFLYVIQRGSSGRWSVLLPHPMINGGRNRVAPYGEVTIPPEGWFRFDENPGSEQVFVYLSREPLATLPWGGGPVVRAQSVDEPTVIELANSIRSRDLVFEKEDAPDGAEQAAYVVNRDDLGDAVAWTVELQHR